MCYYIGIEDLAANALIECLSKKQGDLSQYVITYANLEKYGAQVVKGLTERKEKAILIFGRDNTNMMFKNYSDFFVERDSTEGKGISLANLLRMYMNPKTIAGINVSYGK